MKKYSVLITRTAYSSRYFEVEAENEQEAEEKAMDMTGDYEFKEGDAEYNCEGVMLIDEPDDYDPNYPDPADGVGEEDPAQEVYAEYSKDVRKAVLYVNKQLEPEDRAIICAKVSKNFKQHMNPAYGIDEGKIIDLLEEYGDDHDLPEGWWESETDMDSIVLLIQFEN